MFTVWADICDLCSSKQCLYHGEKYQPDKAALIKLIFLETKKGKLLLVVLRISRVLCFILQSFFTPVTTPALYIVPLLHQESYHNVQTDAVLPTQIICCIRINFFAACPVKV